MGADFEYETPDIAVYINYFANVVVEVGGGDGYLHNGWDGKGYDDRLDVLPLFLPTGSQLSVGACSGSQWGRARLSVGACLALSLLKLQQYRAVLSVSLPTRLIHACISSRTRLL